MEIQPPFLELGSGFSVEVTISNVESPSLMWLLLSSSTANDITEALSKLKLSSLTTAQSGRFCVAPYKRSGQNQIEWRRAQICCVKVEPNSGVELAKIFYIDYGSCTWVSTKLLGSWSDLPTEYHYCCRQAICCRLKDLAPLDDSSWSASCIKALRQIGTLSGTFNAELIDVDAAEKQIYIVDLTCPNNNIGRGINVGGHLAHLKLAKMVDLTLGYKAEREIYDVYMSSTPPRSFEPWQFGFGLGYDIVQTGADPTPPRLEVVQMEIPAESTPTPSQPHLDVANDAVLTSNSTRPPTNSCPTPISMDLGTQEDPPGAYGNSNQNEAPHGAHAYDPDENVLDCWENLCVEEMVIDGSDGYSASHRLIIPVLAGINTIMIDSLLDQICIFPYRFELAIDDELAPIPAKRLTLANQMVDRVNVEPANLNLPVVEEVKQNADLRTISLGNVPIVDMWKFSKGLQADLQYKLKTKWASDANSNQLWCDWCRLNGGEPDWIGANLTDLIRHVIGSHSQLHRHLMRQGGKLSPSGKFWVESKKISIELWNGPGALKLTRMQNPSDYDFISKVHINANVWTDRLIKVRNVYGQPVRVRLEAIEFFGNQPEIFVLRYKNSLLSTSDKQLIPSSSALSTTDEQLIRTDWSHLQPSKVVQLDLSVKLTAKHESLTVAMAFLVAKESDIERCEVVTKAEVKTVLVQFVKVK